MKITVRTIVSSLEALRELSQLKFKAVQAFNVAKVVKDCQTHLENYDVVRVSTIKKFSTDGNQVDENRINDFSNELNEVLDQEVEVYTHSLSLEDFSDLTLAPGHLLLLEWLIKKE